MQARPTRFAMLGSTIAKRSLLCAALLLGKARSLSSEWSTVPVESEPTARHGGARRQGVPVGRARSPAGRGIRPARRFVAEARSDAPGNAPLPARCAGKPDLRHDGRDGQVSARGPYRDPVCLRSRERFVEEGRSRSRRPPAGRATPSTRDGSTWRAGLWTDMRAVPFLGSTSSIRTPEHGAGFMTLRGPGTTSRRSSARAACIFSAEGTPVITSRETSPRSSAP